MADVVTTPTRLFGLGEVRRIAVSPDLRFMATAGQAGAFLWNVDESTLRQRLELAWSATALAFSPDNKTLAVASLRSIFAFDAETGELLSEFVGHQGDIERLLFSPDNQTLISASADNTVRVWSMETGKEMHSVRTRGSPIVDVALSPDGKTLATVDTFLTNCVKIWEIATETQLRALPMTNWTAQRCVFTPAGQLLTASPDRSVLLWDAETTAQIRAFTGITNPAAFIYDVWLPNDSSVAAACSDGSIFLWNLETAALGRVITGEPVITLMGVPSDFLITDASLDYNVRIRQLPEGNTLRTFRGHTTSTHAAVAFSPDGRYVLSGGTERATRLWDLQTGQPIREFVGSSAGTMAAAFSPDGSKVLTTIGLPNPAARLWNAETGALEREFKWTGGWPMSAVFSPDGSKIATRSQGESVRIFDAATGALVKTIPNRAWASALAFSPSGPLIAFASIDYTADLYDYETGQLLHTFSANAGPVVEVAFSPNGETLMIAWQDGLIRLHNTATMELRREFFTPAAFLEAAAYSPDGRYILTGEGWPFFTATLYDAETTQPLRTFLGHKWSVSAVAFSHDGMNILTGADIVREWSVASVAARLHAERLPDHLRLTWAVGELEQAVHPEGPWETVPDASSPLTLPMSDPMRFFRVRLSL